jgi:Na+/H+ antiporter NhaD/arsenite permease-like protein
VDQLVLVVFLAVYLGMLLGEIPPLALDRTGVAILGAIVLVASERITPPMAWEAVDVSTLALLAGLMVVSAQLRLSGFYTAVARKLAAAPLAPPAALGAVLLAAAGLSAVLVNDIVCLAMAPILVEGCARRGWDPVPFLLGLAAAANIGSAATLIGNPQNMLIAQKLALSFAGYFFRALPVVVASLGVLWAVLVWQQRGLWYRHTPIPQVSAPELSRYQAAKGVLVMGVLLVVFFLGHWPRDVAALAAAGVLLTSRRMASRDMLGLVDWQLLALFIGLFVVNHAFLETGWMGVFLGKLASWGVALDHPAVLFWASALFSNLVSNVPAVMLLLPSASHPASGPILALSSTLAGNLLVVGSIANIIVVEQAARLGVEITAKTHARVGVVVTLITLALAFAWVSLLW